MSDTPRPGPPGEGDGERDAVYEAWRSARSLARGAGVPPEDVDAFAAWWPTGTWVRKVFDPTLGIPDEVTCVPDDVDVDEFVTDLIAGDAEWIRGAGAGTVADVSRRRDGDSWFQRVAFNDGTGPQTDTYQVSRGPHT